MELKELYQLMDRFEKSGLSELTWRREKDLVRLRKGPPPGRHPCPVPPGFGPAPAAFPPPGTSPSAVPADSSPRSDPGSEVITAPLVGTFFRAPTPDAAPFVEKGDRVKKGQTLCILEAMKLMNEFQAEFDLQIVAILAENAKMVEFGTPLFEVRKL
jgi:acetyl-CoA carboxylase biotin carboxyl carrier protein